MSSRPPRLLRLATTPGFGDLLGVGFIVTEVKQLEWTVTRLQKGRLCDEKPDTV